MVGLYLHATKLCGVSSYACCHASTVISLGGHSLISVGARRVTYRTPTPPPRRTPTTTSLTRRTYLRLALFDGSSPHRMANCFFSTETVVDRVSLRNRAPRPHSHTTEGDGVHRHCGAGRRRSAILILSVYPSCPYRTILHTASISATPVPLPSVPCSVRPTFHFRSFLFLHPDLLHYTPPQPPLMLARRRSDAALKSRQQRPDDAGMVVACARDSAL